MQTREEFKLSDACHNGGHDNTGFGWNLWQTLLHENKV